MIALLLVDDKRFELSTSAMRTQRSPKRFTYMPKNHPKIDTHTQNFATKTRKMYMASFHS